ncbi:FAD-dependent oxidoreductase [Amycolatopsis echigonensis]
MVNQPDITVVGAGAVGLSTALFLAQAGASVEVVDSGGIGAGASRKNAGWIVPSMSEPVPSPAALRAAAKWFGRRDGPLKIGLEPSAGYVSFLARMLLAARPAVYRQGLAATASLAAGAVAAFDELVRLGVDFERHVRGVLLVFVEEHGIQPHLDDLAAMEKFGLPGAQLLAGKEVRELEPEAGQDVVGGILCHGDHHVDPSSLVDGLAAAGREAGVRLRLHAPVTEIVEGAGCVRLTAGGVTSSTGALVLAAGVGTRALTAMVGKRVSIRGGKGYGFDYRPAPFTLGHAVYLSDHKVAVTPLDQGIRIAGTMEFGAENNKVDHRRAAGVAAAMRAYFPGWPVRAPRPWTGLRPLTPDGLPVIGRLPTRAPIYVAAGHAMLGITLGPITGKLLSRQILTGEIQPLLAPFALDRFRSARSKRG